MERAAGIEPACLTWKDSALPLSYARNVEANKTSTLAVEQVFFSSFGKLFWIASEVRKEAPAK